MGSLLGGGQARSTPTNNEGYNTDPEVHAPEPPTLNTPFGEVANPDSQVSAPKDLPPGVLYASEQEKLAAEEKQVQASPTNPAAAAKVTEGEDSKKLKVSRDTARQRQEGLGSGASYRRSTLLGGLLGLSDANLSSAKKTLLGG